MQSKRVVFYQLDEDVMGPTEWERRRRQLAMSLAGEKMPVESSSWPRRVFGRMRRMIFGLPR